MLLLSIEHIRMLCLSGLTIDRAFIFISSSRSLQVSLHICAHFHYFLFSPFELILESSRVAAASLLSPLRFFWSANQSTRTKQGNIGLVKLWLSCFKLTSSKFGSERVIALGAVGFYFVLFIILFSSASPSLDFLRLCLCPWMRGPIIFQGLGMMCSRAGAQ